MFDLWDSWQFNLMLYYGFNVVFLQSVKAVVRGAKNEAATAVSLQLVAGLGALVVSPLMVYRWPSKIETIMLLGLAIIFYAVNDRLQVTVRKNLNVSIYSILGQVHTAILFLFGVTIFQESVTWARVAGALVIVAAVMVLFLGCSTGNIGKPNYLWLALFVQLILAIAISVDVGISDQFNLGIYIAVTLLVPGLLIALWGRLGVADVTNALVLGGRIQLLAGLSWTLTILFSLRSFRLGEVVVVAPLQSIGVVLNVVAAAVIYKESGSLLRKLGSAAGLIAGVFLLVQ